MLDRSKLLWLIKLCVAATIIIVVARQVDSAKLVDRFASAHVWPFAAATVATTIAIFANAQRWNSLTAHLQLPIGLRVASTGYFEAMFFNQILPTGLGGDAVRGMRAYDAGLSVGLATLSVLLDRAFGLLSTALLILLAAGVGHTPIIATPIFSVLTIVSAIIVAGAVAGIIIGALVNPESCSKWIRPFAWAAKGFSTSSRSIPTVSSVIAMLIIANALSVCAISLCAASVGIQISWWNSMLLTQAIALSAIVPFSIGGWGVREGTSMLLLAPLGVSSTDATAISIIFGFVLTLNALMGAAVWAFSGYQRLGRQQNIAVQTPPGAAIHNETRLLT